MKFTRVLFAILLTLALEGISAQVNYEQSLSFSESNYQLQDLISEVFATTQVNFSYSSSVVNPEELVILKSQSYTLGEFLDEVTNQLSIDYIEFRDKILFVERKTEWQPFQIYRMPGICTHIKLHDLIRPIYCVFAVCDNNTMIIRVFHQRV